MSDQTNLKVQALLDLLQEIEDYCDQVIRSAEIHLESADYLESEVKSDVGCFDLGKYFGELKGATSVASCVVDKIDEFYRKHT